MAAIQNRPAELHAPQRKPSTWWFLSQIGDTFVYLKKKEAAQGKPLLSSPSPHWLLFLTLVTIRYPSSWPGPRSPDSNYSAYLPPGLLFRQEKNRVAQLPLCHSEDRDRRISSSRTSWSKWKDTDPSLTYTPKTKFTGWSCRPAGRVLAWAWMEPRVQSLASSERRHGGAHL